MTRRGSFRPPRAWIGGWAAGGAVVAIAAGLILTLVGFGRRIVRQAGEITEALNGAQANTRSLFAVTETNTTIERVTARLRAVREGAERA